MLIKLSFSSSVYGNDVAILNLHLMLLAPLALILCPLGYISVRDGYVSKDYLKVSRKTTQFF